MKLSIPERIGLLGILPEKGNFVTLRVVDEARRLLSFTEREIKDWGIVAAEEGRVSWNPQKAVDGDVKIGDAVRELIAKKLKELDEKEELLMAMYSLYERFVDKK